MQAEPAALRRPAHRDATLRAALDALHDARLRESADLSRRLAQGDDVEAKMLHGLALGGLGEALASARLLCEVARAHPGAMHPCADLAGLLAKQRRSEDCAPVFKAALDLTPSDPRLWLAYGEWLAARWHPEAAATALRRSLSLRPGDAAAMNQLGIVLVSLGEIEAALALFRDVVATNPSNHAAWANLGCALANEGAFEEALSYYHRAIGLRSDDARIRLNHSICLLKSGRMTQGWSEHEWRFALPGHTDLPRHLLLPTLAPATDLSGTTVLVTQEEGLGDTLMYLRYAPALADRGAQVALWVPETLRRVAARVEPRARILVGDVPHPHFDWHCPFISLPRAMAGTQSPLGVPVPYLHTDPERVAALGRRLPPRTVGRDGKAALRVGLVWGGAPRPDDPVAHGIDRRRSIGLAALAPLAGLEGVSLISLQAGHYRSELANPPAGLVLHDPMDAARDMDDTASLILNLDLVVTVDTSIVHLAGGLGRPVLLLDRYDNCWRWHFGREDSDWYPTVRILRQPRPGDWGSVVERLVSEIEKARGSGPSIRFAARSRRA